VVRRVSRRAGAERGPAAGDGLTDLDHHDVVLARGDLDLARAVQVDPVGIDLEKLRAIPDWQELAESMMPAEVIAEILALRKELQANEFLRRFTAVEAVLKLRGSGFSDKMAPHPSRAVPGSKPPYDCVALPGIPGYMGHLCLAK
jgi:hypothetical protein